MSREFDRLKAAGIENPARELRILQNHFEGDDLQQAIDARIERKPMSQILGFRDFWLDRFIVNENVLDPRADSELFLDIISNIDGKFERILDLGTGSGALGLSALRVFPNARAVLADLSESALDVARENATRLGLAEQVECVQSNWFQNISGEFDLILCNPPYLTQKELKNAEPELQFEPENALSDFSDGLTHYKEISANLAEFLAPKGIALFEHGWTQQGEVAQIFENAGFTVKKYRDLSKKPRIVAVFLPESAKIME